MRIISKMQAGGGYIPTTYTPLPPITATYPQAAASSASAETKGEQLLTEATIKELATKSLQSDLEVFVSKSDLFGNSLFEDSLFQDLTNSDRKAKELLLYMNKMANEKALFDKSIENIRSIDATSEAALSVNGGIFVYRNNKIQHIGIGDLKEGERPITNGELAHIRANSTGAAFNTNMTYALNNATSMKQIRSVIDNVLSGLGTYKKDVNYYLNPKSVDSNNKGDLAVLQELAQMNISLDDLQGTDLNSLVEVNIKDSSNAKQVTNAVRSIYSQLPTNMRQIIQLRAKELDTDPMALILEYASSKLSGDVSKTMDVVNTSDGSRGKNKSGSGDDSKLKMTPSMLALAGIGSREWVTLSPGTNAEINALATNSVLTEQNGKALEQQALAGIISSQQAGLLNLNSATFGGVKIDQAQFGSIMLESSNYKMLDLPIDIREYNKTGVIKPDIELTKKIQEIEKQIKDDNITDVESINALYANANLPVKYSGRDSNGNPILNINAYRKFAALDVIADEQGIPEDIDMDDYEEYVKQVDDDNIVANMEAVLKKYNDSFSASTGFWGGNDIWRGVMYIPVYEHGINAYIASNKDLTETDAMRLDKEENARIRATQVKNAHKTVSWADTGLNY